MKKLLGSVLAIAMLVQPGLASAELLKNFKLGGQIDIQSAASRNVLDFTTRQAELWAAAGSAANNAVEERPTYNDRANEGQTRVLLSMDWDILDDVHAKITLRKNDRAWGSGTNTAQAFQTGLLPGAGLNANAGYQTLTGATGAGTVGSGGNVLDAVAVDQAYVKVDKVFGHVDATLGRQYYGDAGDPVIYFGPSDKSQYGLPTSALDALRVDVQSLPMFNITGLAAKVVGTPVYQATINGGSNNDIDVRGLVASLKDVENVNLDVFIYNRLRHGTGPLGFAGDGCVDLNADGDVTDAGECTAGLNDNLYIYGFKGKVNFAGFTGKFFFAKNAGENRNVTALNWDYGKDGAIDGFDRITPAQGSYRGFAWTLDGEYKADIEDVASFTPWLHLGWGSGRNSLKDSKNEGFTAINPDYRPGTIYGRYGAFLGNGIPCAWGAPGCTPAAALPAAAVNAIANSNDGINGVDGRTGFRQIGTHMGAANIGGVGLNNRMIWGLGLKTTPAFANKLTVALSFWQFRWQKNTDDRVFWKEDDTAASPCNANDCFINLPTAGLTGDYFDGFNNTQGYSNGRGQKHIGDEYDIDLTWKHSDNVTFAAGAASFRPGKYIQNMIADNYNISGAAGANVGYTGMRVANNPVVLAYGDMRIKF